MSFMTKVYLGIAVGLCVLAVAFADNLSLDRQAVPHGLAALGFGIAAAASIVASALVHRDSSTGGGGNV